MIGSGTITITELSSILGYSKAKLHNFLSFANVPDKIWHAVGKKDKVSSRAAATILAISKIRRKIPQCSYPNSRRNQVRCRKFHY